MQFPRLNAVSSFWKRAASGSHKAEPSNEGNTERLREAMLDLLHKDGSPATAKLTHRILAAAGCRDLWYLRGDLMSVLSGLHGEAHARDKIASLDPGFRRGLPSAMPLPRGASLVRPSQT
jgi:hypothetical protein